MANLLNLRENPRHNLSKWSSNGVCLQSKFTVDNSNRQGINLEFISLLCAQDLGGNYMSGGASLNNTSCFCNFATAG